MKIEKATFPEGKMKTQLKAKKGVKYKGESNPSKWKKKKIKLRTQNAGWLFLLKHKKWKYLHNTKAPSNEIMGKSQVQE